MKQLPEMVFGKSFIKVAHKSGYLLEFTAEDSLKCIVMVDQNFLTNRIQNRVQIFQKLLTQRFGNKGNTKDQYCQFFSKEQTLQETGLSPDLHKNVIEYDWTYTTTYKGTLPNMEVSIFGTILIFREANLKLQQRK